MNPDQVCEITARAKSACPHDQHIWFIWVFANWVDKEHSNASCIAFFSPTSRSDAVWKGQFAAVGPNRLAEMMAEVIRKTYGDQYGSPKPHEPTLQNYIFIVPKDREYHESALPIPTPARFPFTTPTDVSESDVVEIAEWFFERKLKSLDWQPHREAGRYYVPSSIDETLPIRAIQKTTEGFEIRTGVQEDILSGSGELVRIRRDATGIEIISIGQWVS